MPESQTSAVNHKFKSLKTWQSGAKIALFPTQPIQWYIWWPNNKVGPKITLFPTQLILW